MKKYIYKILLVVSFFFLTGFGGCELLGKLFSLLNYGTNQGYNDVVEFYPNYYYATDGGNIYSHTGEEEDPWELEITAPGNPDLLDINGEYPFAIICVGENGTILTGDADSNWEIRNSNVTVTLNKILIYHIAWTYFIVGNNGTVLRSSNRGETWSQLSFPTTDNLYDITENQSTIFVSGENYCFYKSTDDGETWLPTGPGDVPVLGPASSYNKIYFYDENIGYVGGPNGLVLKTYDGGKTWVNFVVSGFSEINDLFFISPDSGAAVGPDGVVRFTTDGGGNWFEDPDLTTFLNGETIKRIVPLGMNHGFVIGENGFDIFVAKDSTYLDSLPLVTSVEYENIMVTEFHLLQNYPNPFNPSTTISFSLPEVSFVTLKIFNSLGEEIETLLSKELSAGNYKYDWNAINLPSGIYFYKLQAGSFVETKKMILLK
jgi:photosystem II stability/assembly factor-like uncharacterized protein